MPSHWQMGYCKDLWNKMPGYWPCNGYECRLKVFRLRILKRETA